MIKNLKIKTFNLLKTMYNYFTPFNNYNKIKI